MNLSEMYARAEEALSRVDFEKIFPGFHRFDFALYTSGEVCLNGEILSPDERFCGNTAIDFDGRQIAIWDIELDPAEDAERLAASLVHEMFHCRQKASGERRFPSDLALLDYPADEVNLREKHSENLCLAECFEHESRGALEKFCAIRNARIKLHPKAARQELFAETVEGAAEYAGLCALRQLDEGKFRREAEVYVEKLKSCGKILLDPRRMTYFSGAVFLLCLAKLGIAVKNDFGSGLSLYEQNRITEKAELSGAEYAFIAPLCAADFSAKDEKIAAHIAAARFVECAARICGYDPMNMFRRGNKIYCSHFVFLDCGDRTESIFAPTVLELEDGSDDRISGYWRR